ncbi:CU044_2847 family protein [Nodosilinea nodulosa]|uniref:CU044_2847 family protein n=1 Tax=Nodosilinea nodulosa TaxID=416001 RepID=UPI0003753C48|nr:CU044_2847 family protein [Nodosilinea nodulosa]
MSELSFNSEKISVSLPNGSTVKFEASGSGRKEVSFKSFSFQEIEDALLGITDAIKETIRKIEPQKASVKFGIEIGVESGNLTAIIVKGASKANLEITLEWEK